MLGMRSLCPLGIPVLPIGPMIVELSDIVVQQSDIVDIFLVEASVPWEKFTLPVAISEEAFRGTFLRITLKRNGMIV